MNKLNNLPNVTIIRVQRRSIQQPISSPPLTITDLPEKFIEKLMTYLPLMQLKNCMQVNKFFYKAVTSAIDKNSWMVLETEFALNRHYNSIVLSDRVIPSIRIGSDVFSNFDFSSAWPKLSLIFQKFGKHFKQIELLNCLISMKDLKHLLFLSFYIERLYLRACKAFPNVNSNICFINLKLTDLSLVYCCPEIQKIALALAPNTVTSFTIISPDIKVFPGFVMKQNRLKKLVVHSYVYKSVFNTVAFFEKMKLTDLSFRVETDQQEALTILLLGSQAKTLESVELITSNPTNMIFHALIDAKKLKKLKIVVNEISSEYFEGFKEFKKLKELQLIKNIKDEHIEHLKIISKHKIAGLVKLEILYPSTVIDQLNFFSLFSNFPNLQHLYIDAKVTTSLLLNIVSFMKSLKSLTLFDPQKIEMKEEIVQLVTLENRSLKELNLNFNLLNNFYVICEFASKFDNLQKLSFTVTINEIEFTILLHDILESLKQLQEIAVDNTKPFKLEEIPETFILAINDHKNLQKITFNVEGSENLPLMGLIKFNFIMIEGEELKMHM